MASPADHQTGLQKAMIIQKNPFPHPVENLPGVQIRPVAPQKENIAVKAQVKNALILPIANLMVNVQGAANTAAVLAVAIKKHTLQKSLIVADRLIAMHQKEIMAVTLQVKRNHLHQEINHIQAG
jgi:hypothetical protein